MIQRKKVRKTIQYLVVLVGVLVLLLEIFFGWPVGIQALYKSTPTPRLPVISEPVTPDVSQDVKTLPTVTPRPPGVPAPEVNPRQRSNH